MPLVSSQDVSHYVCCHTIRTRSLSTRERLPQAGTVIDSAKPGGLTPWWLTPAAISNARA